MGKRVPIGRTMVLFFRGVRGHPQHRANPHFMSYGHPCFFCGGILFQFQVVRCWGWSEYGQRSRGFLARHPIYTVAQAWPTPDKAFRSRTFFFFFFSTRVGYCLFVVIIGRGHEVKMSLG